MNSGKDRMKRGKLVVFPSIEAFNRRSENARVTKSTFTIVVEGESSINNDSIDLPFKNEEFHVQQRNESIDMWTQSGLYLHWNMEEILLAAPVQIANRLCGLCGNFQNHHMKKNTQYKYIEGSSLEKQECIVQKEDPEILKSHQPSLFAERSLFQYLTIFTTLYILMLF
ncbi:sushi, von Willebrand factor type A, EGF and pentraxin domain-containing protein 1 [Trichonephila clavipes]|uniref:Sushi, von Willebrand factor type A, EGF and pentraxin domain-containing protein 1 n=1 Tax=Trichonephila clavipes TaxID=2585209 RepID=A0A8X6R9C8_TRICX|nr:sushi, von Willebrand factor type A, EGF and pentraxin domain-containing protein 1 [Trichonephila clavipes]